MIVRRPIDFSAVIKSARRTQEMSQSELAVLCNTTQSAISRVEKTGLCQLDTLLRICAVLDLKIDISLRDTSASPLSDNGVW
jgi:transcriptional regulator with XRE-family HTH domain